MMKQLPVSERPREKALRYGVDSLSNRELLALLIRHGTAGYSALDIADELLKEGLQRLPQLKLNELMDVKGIKQVKALELLSWFELSRRIASEKIMNRDVIKDPDSLIQWCMLKLGSLQQEHFLAVFLNVHNEVISYKILFTGTVDMSVVHPREIFKEAVNVSCSKLLVVHNHPTGHLEPSIADLQMTENLCNAGSLMKIPVVDHLIVSSTEYFSFREHGIL